MPDPTQLDRLEREIRSVSAHLTSAAESLVEVGRALRALVESSAPVATAKAAPTETDWEGVVAGALQLLRADPKRWWRASVLAQAVREQGVRVANASGMHFGLRRRLEELGAVEARGQMLRLRDPAGVSAVPSPPPGSPVAGAPDWPALLTEAERLLRQDPERQWREGELAREASQCGAGVGLGRGLPSSLARRLREAGLVEPGKALLCLAPAAPVQAPVPSEPPAQPQPAPVVASAKPTSEGAAEPARVEDSEAPAVAEWPWEAMVAKAAELLQADPSRQWPAAELCGAVIRAGLAGPTRRGMHFGLLARLTRAKLAVVDNNLVRAAPVEGAPPAQPVPEPPPALPKEPKVAHATPVEPTVAQVAAPPAPVEQVQALVEEIDLVEPILSRLSDEARTAQVALWAGRARALQDELLATGSTTGASLLRQGFGRLTRLARDWTRWVDALTPTWSTDWPVYVAANRAIAAGREPELSEEQLKVWHRGLLTGLSVPQRHLQAGEAEAVLDGAAQHLDEGDPALVEALRRFGRRPAQPPRRTRKERPAEPEIPPEPKVDVPADVLRTTRGMRALMV
ncbi:MAG: hypothetical protein HY901_21060, partial [Deltaproteobacteria bacterium]|nr:hypothetical protein [Deltaproteobacteria bacterium]